VSISPDIELIINAFYLARTMAKLLCQFCAISLQKQAIFGEMC